MVSEQKYQQQELATILHLFAEYTTWCFGWARKCFHCAKEQHRKSSLSLKVKEWNTRRNKELKWPQWRLLHQDSYHACCLIVPDELLCWFDDSEVGMHIGCILGCTHSTTPLQLTALPEGYHLSSATNIRDSHSSHSNSFSILVVSHQDA